MTQPRISSLRVSLRGAVAASFLLASSTAAASEAGRAAALLGLEPGMNVAEVGAGDGDFALDFAERVGPDGRVYATEMETEKRQAIAAEAKEQGLANVEVIAAQIASTGLPESCCRAVFMRHVYHHLTEPAAINRDLLRALQPGALLVIVDFKPTWFMRHSAPEGVGGERTGHGIALDAALRELVAAGFEEVQVIADWETHWFVLDTYALVLRKPSADRAP